VTNPNQQAINAPWTTVGQRHDACSAPAIGLPATWLTATSRGVAENLAIDEALLEEAHEGRRLRPVARAWVACSPAVVVGSSSRVADEVDLAACRKEGLPVVRRSSGGATVVVGPGCLMWSLVLPCPDGPPTVERLHASILAAVVAAFGSAGVNLRRRGTSDLVLGDRKVAGNALRVRRGGVLYHGTLLDAFDLGLISRVLRHPPREPDYRESRSHEAFLANLELGGESLQRLIRTAFAADDAAEPCDPARTARLLEQRYANEAWNGRL